MNKLTIIGNLTRDPELRTTSTGVNVCDFTVAVNKKQTQEQRQQNVQPQADFFRVSAWRERGEICAKYLAKGRKVCVIGPVSVRTYTGNDGVVRASLEVTADEVEFLSSRQDGEAAPAAAGSDPNPMESGPKTAQNPAGFTPVETDELPF